MKLIIHHATPKAGHSTTEIDLDAASAVAEVEAIFANKHSIVVVGDEIVRNYQELMNRVSIMDPVPAQTEVFIMPQMAGGNR